MKKIILLLILFIGFMGVQNAQNIAVETFLENYSKKKGFTCVSFPANDIPESKDTSNISTVSTTYVYMYKTLLICDKRVSSNTQKDFLNNLQKIIEEEKFKRARRTTFSVPPSGGTYLREEYTTAEGTGKLTIHHQLVEKSGVQILIYWEWENTQIARNINH